MPRGARPVGSPERVRPAVLLQLLLGLALSLHAEQKDLDPSLTLNVTFNTSSRMLSWDCLENATNHLYIYEGMESPAMLRPGDACACVLGYHVLHNGAKFEVHASVQGKLFRGALRVTNPGPKGSAAQNLTCGIHDGSYLNCTWARGPAAPRDTQYFLFIENTRTHRRRECPLYTADAGTHTGCHLQNLSGVSFYNYFLLNGTSTETPIQFFDAIWSTKQMERMSPPGNVTVRCNATHCHVTWARPRTKTALTYRDFLYQLDIQRQNAEPGGRSTPVELAGEAHNSYSFPSPDDRGRRALRIRVRDARGGPWGAWSRPVDFGSDPQDSPALSLYIPVVLSTLLCALVLGFLFKRFLGVRRLCPRIPQVKDKLSELDGAAPQVPWEDATLSLEKADAEEVLRVQEVPAESLRRP